MRSLWLCVLLFATTVQAQGVTLAWDYRQGTEPAVKFRVYRQPSCTGVFVVLTPDVAPVGSAPATYSVVDTSVVKGETYCWTATALAADGGESTTSNVVRFKCKRCPHAN